MTSSLLSIITASLHPQDNWNRERLQCQCRCQWKWSFSSPAHQTRHLIRPPNFLSTHSCFSFLLFLFLTMTFEFQQFRRSLNETLGPLCDVSCNPSNHYGSCLAPCWMLCPSVCPDPTLAFYPPPIPSPQKPSKSINPLPIVIPVLITICFALFLFFLHARRRSHSTAPPVVTETREGFLDEEHGPVLDHPIWYIRTVGLQASTIDSIAVFKYRKGDGVVDVTDCSVCLSEFQEDEVLRLLPKCTHAFHIACIDTWLRSHTNCPVCRAPVAVTPPRAPSTEVNSGNSSVSGEAQVDTLEENGEQRREIEVAVCEIELNTREGGEGLAVGSGGTEPAIRSISIDSSEASKISRAIALNSSEESPTSDMTSENRSAKGKELGQGSDSRRIGGSQRFLRLVGSSPIGRSLQSGPIFLKRSATGYPESSLP